MRPYMMKSDEERAADAIKSNEEQAAAKEMEWVKKKDAQNTRNDVAQKKTKLEGLENMKSNEVRAAEAQLKQVEKKRKKAQKAVDQKTTQLKQVEEIREQNTRNAAAQRKKEENTTKLVEGKKIGMLKYLVAKCMIRSMSYYDNRQRSFNWYNANSNCYFWLG